MTATTSAPVRAPDTVPPASRTSPARRHQTRAAYTFLAPVLAYFAVFFVLPVLFALVLALSRWSGFDLADIRPVGLDNFAAIFGRGSTFVTPILVNTLAFALGSMLLSVFGALVLANAINRLRFQGFWRTLYFLPIVTTVVAVGNVWKYLYQPAGLVNGLLNRLGVTSVPFLTDPDTALPSVVVVQAWFTIGLSILIITAGLKAIPETYYEAAALDGASQWRTFWQITVPLLRPTMLFVTVTQTIAGLQQFAMIIVMTDGGPADATNVAGYEMFKQAFTFGDWGVASAMAFVLFVLIFGMTALQLAFFRRRGGEV